MSLDQITNPVLYSTMTKLAFNINKRYYGDLHYMWCTPYFGTNYSAPNFTVPPSSSPLEIYNALKAEVDSGDRHGTQIKIKRLGVKRGANAMQRRGKISKAQEEEILEICRLAPRELYLPLLCVIPRLEVVPYSLQVNVKAKAHPLSQEYIVADVPQAAFDVIRIG